MDNTKYETKKEEFEPPKRRAGSEVLNCPITASQQSVVTFTFCKGCQHFGGVQETDEETMYVECRYPRRVKVIDVYGAGSGRE